MAYLIDASVLIDWLKGQPDALQLLDDFARRGEILAVNAISLAELYSGFSEDEREREEPFLASLTYWEIDREVAELAGTYRYNYRRQGRPLSVPDVLMAAHAVTRGATLITGNVRDFPMPELKLLRLP